VGGKRTNKFVLIGGVPGDAQPERLNSGDYAYLGASGYVDIEDSTFSRSSGFNLYTGGSSYALFKRNIYNPDSLVSVNIDATLARPWFKEWGSSMVPKFFQGNRLYRSWIDVGSPNWTIGAAKGCTPDKMIASGNMTSGYLNFLMMMGVANSTKPSHAEGLDAGFPAIPFFCWDRQR